MSVGCSAVLQYGLAKDVREREMDHLKVAERKLEGLQDQLRVLVQCPKHAYDPTKNLTC